MLKLPHFIINIFKKTHKIYSFYFIFPQKIGAKLHKKIEIALGNQGVQLKESNKNHKFNFILSMAGSKTFTKKLKKKHNMYAIAAMLFCMRRTLSKFALPQKMTITTKKPIKCPSKWPKKS